MITVANSPSHSDQQARIRQITMADLTWSLRQGWDDFREKRGDILIVALVYPVFGLLVAMFAIHGQLLPLVFPLFAGLSLMGPAIAAGFYELAKRREEGSDTHWRHFLDAYRGKALAAIAPVTLLLALIFTAWLGSAWLLYAANFGPEATASIGGFLTAMFTTAAGWRLILIGNLVGFAFAVIVLATSVVALPMLIDRHGDPAAAVTVSLRATWQNAAMMIVWGLIVSMLLVVGALLLMVGLAVVLPVLGYATWHLYTRLIER
jgi:uncharacterized membrane protein